MNTQKLSDELQTTYNINGKISSFAYLSSITHSDVTDFDEQVSSVIKDFGISSKINIEEYVKNSDFKSRLSTDFFKDSSGSTFYYEQDKKQLVLDVWGKSESIEISSVLSNLIKSKIVKRVVVDGNRLRIYFSDDESSIVDIPLSDMINVLSGDGKYIDISNAKVQATQELCNVAQCLSSGYQSWNSAYSVIRNISSATIPQDGIALSTSQQMIDLVKKESNKVNFDDRILSVSGQNDLSVVKLPLSDYELSVAFGCLDKLSNCLFVTDGDHINAYGGQICAVTMNNETDPSKNYYGLAATDKYVDFKTKNSNTWDIAYGRISSLQSDILSDSIAVSTDVQISNMIGNHGKLTSIEQNVDSVKDSLKNAVLKLSSQISGNIDDLQIEKIISGLIDMCNAIIS